MDWGFLKGHKPTENDAIQPMSGSYVAVVNSIKPDTNRNTGEPQITAEFQIAEVLDGDGNPGRKLWKRYAETEEGIGKLIDDLFTSGITVDRSSEDSFKASLDGVAGKTVHVRCWVWTPENDREGNPIEEADRRSFQQFAIVSEKRLAKLKAKAGSAKF